MSVESEVKRAIDLLNLAILRLTNVVKKYRGEEPVPGDNPSTVAETPADPNAPKPPEPEAAPEEAGKPEDTAAAEDQARAEEEGAAEQGQSGPEPEKAN